MWDRTFGRALHNHFPSRGFEGLKYLGVSVTITPNLVRCNGIDVFVNGRWYAHVPKLRKYLLAEVLKDNRRQDETDSGLKRIEEIFS